MSMNNPIITIRALGDNYIHIYQHDNNNAFVVDPGQSSSVLNTLSRHNLNLTTILATHHHYDHIGGITDLKRKTGCKVIGGDKNRINGIDIALQHGQSIAIGTKRIKVIATPGHTTTSVCYYLEPTCENESGILFTGDTLFFGGCGRLFECDAKTMWHSLSRLAALPAKTVVYCGHDYTLENYEFAVQFEPDNQATINRLNHAKTNEDLTSSTISQEKETNIFLRADNPQVKAAVNMPEASAVEVFAELRKRKDFF